MKRKASAKDGVKKAARTKARPFSHITAEAMGGPYSIDGLDFQDRWARLHCLRCLHSGEPDTGAEFYGVRIEGVDDVTLYWLAEPSKLPTATEYVQMKLRVDAVTLNGVLRNFLTRHKQAPEARQLFRVVAGSCSENLRTLREFIARVKRALEPGGELSREYRDSRADLDERLRTLKLNVDPDFILNSVLLELNKSSLLDGDEYNALLRSEMINLGIPRDKIAESTLRLNELITSRRHGTFIPATQIRVLLESFLEKAESVRSLPIMVATPTEMPASSLLPISARPRVEISLFPGGAALIEFEDGRLGLIDCGRAATEQVISHMKRRNARRFALVAVTHWHLDHYSGLPGILDYAKHVDVVYLPGFEHFRKVSALTQSAEMVIKWVHERVVHRHTKYLSASGWHKILWGKEQDKRASVRISISGPADPFPGLIHDFPARGRHVDQNAQSAIFRVAVGEAAFLVPGDATLNRWRDALSQAREHDDTLVSDGVFLPHHGSKFSMSSEILSRITKPTSFLAAVEPLKRHGLPHGEVLQSVERLGGRVISFSDAPIHLRLEEEGLFHRVGAR